MRQLYQITTYNACFGVEVEDGVIVDSAPIAKYYIGKPLDALLTRYRAVAKQVRTEHDS